MSGTPTVSVVTIFLDEERFLADAVDSVLAQSFGDWELLLCDDGSSDGSVRIAREYAERHPDRIRYLQHPDHANLGMSATRNLGLRHARGEFVALLDADDVWLPQKLESQLALLRDMPGVDMVCSPSRFWYGWTGRPEDAQRDAWRVPAVALDAAYDPPALLRRMLQNRIAAPATCSVLMRRTAVEAVGGFEDRFRGLYEDQAFFAKLFLASRVFIGSESWDLYRQHPDSTCHAAARVGDYDAGMPHVRHHDFLCWLEDHMRHTGVTDVRVWRALRRELWLYRHPRLHQAARVTQAVPDRATGFFWERAVPVGLSAGRRVLPTRVREWLWSRWQRRSGPAPRHGSELRGGPAPRDGVAAQR